MKVEAPEAALVDLRCDTCKWWLPYTKNGKATGDGECRRYPPQCVTEVWSESSEYDELGTRGPRRIRSDIKYCYPDTASDEFCGEWKRGKVKP